MKPILLPLASLAALTLMTGAVVSHWLGVDEQVELALLRANGPAATQDLDQMPASDSGAQPRLITAPRGQARRPAARPLDLTPDVEDRLIRALEAIEQMHRGQENLRDQVAETNRDLMELQFRVDSHSESFRPLRATQESEIPAGTGVLPPLDTP
jgi:hypothetical protein